MKKMTQTLFFLPDGSLDIVATLQTMAKRHALPDVTLLHQACVLTQQWTQGLTTFYGQPCLQQGLEAAETLLSLQLDQETAAAAILCCIDSPTVAINQTIQTELGGSVSKLVLGFQQVKLISTLLKQEQQSPTQLDKMRKLLLAMATDIRVVIIKLAERLCLLRGIKAIPLPDRQRYAREVMDIYAPLANRLGIGQLKLELEDLSLRYLEPETYSHIANFLAERRVLREARIQSLIQQIQHALHHAHIKATVTGRAKHIYSIYAKAKRNQLTYHEIFDYNAIRVLVDTIEASYAALGLIHQLWIPIEAEFDDYIGRPKPNGYRSLHTAVREPDGKIFEVQIRTEAMHEEAERGVAAHWAYKEQKQSATPDLSKITYLRQLLDWHRELMKDNQHADKINETLCDDIVYVITPAGDILSLPVGSTPLDFAYHIHSDIGHHCRGSKVNGRIAHLKTRLKTGDKVEILTAPEGGPSRDWMKPDAGYLKSSRALSKVAHWFKQHDPQQTAANSPKTAKVAERKPITATPTQKPVEKKTRIEIAGASRFLTRVAKCCKPIPGDTIIGYISQGKGLSIHKKNCHNIEHLANRHRLMAIEWDNKNIGMFNTDLKISATQKDRLLHDISAFLAAEQIPLLSFSSHFKPNQHKASLLLTVQVQNMFQLDGIMERLKQLPGILDVQRISDSR
ncbi:MAG: hypothetical protein A3E85_05075 [Gammaproteobacteria bacterium RIFCSPHIGHO2_12_FULL_45_12]|nr:MAG: hypothetical protein A3E85_05075 [Gammaproteobacteria bacterium RIFCSPHIGHO2_12_FULL_45_12]